MHFDMRWLYFFLIEVAILSINIIIEYIILTLVWDTIHMRNALRIMHDYACAQYKHIHAPNYFQSRMLEESIEIDVLSCYG